MKKFWIIFSIIMAVLIGVNGFLFIPNSFAMTTIVSQKSGKIQTVVKNAMDKVDKHDYFSLTLSYEEPVPFDYPHESYVSNIKLKRLSEDNFEFYGTVTKTTKDSKGSKKIIENSEVCFKEDVFYKHILKSEGVEESKTKQEMSWKDAFKEATGINPTQIFPFNSEFEEYIFSDSKYNSSMFLGFKPFLFGQKYLITKNNMPDETKKTATYYIDLFGNLKQFKFKFADSQGHWDTYSISITYNNFKKVTVTSPTDAADYVLVEEE